MPQRPLKPCAVPGCSTLTRERCCEAHAKQRQQEQDERRGSSAQRGYGYRWQQARARFLQKHPLCVLCLANGKTEAATVVDHKTPHRGDDKLFWDQENWQPLCKMHHDEKTGSGS